MTEIDLYKMQEAEGFGAFLLHAIADDLGVEPNEKAIDRAIYKGTDCGAWARFDAEGCIVGTIVEGSDAEYSERVSITGIEPGDEGAKEFHRRFWEAVGRCEEFAEENFYGD
jgi:hypothetical protein